MIVANIRASQLAPPVYRTARELLDHADESTGALALRADELLEHCCLNAEGTARHHLIELQNAGVLIYKRRKGVFHIWFSNWDSADGDQHVSVDHEKTDRYAAKSRVLRPNRALHGQKSDELAPTDDEKTDRHAAKSRVTRPNRAADGQLPHTHADAPSGRMDGSLTNPDRDNHPSIPDAPTEPKPTPEEERMSRALLEHVGMIPANVDKFAAAVSFERIRCFVADWWMRRHEVGGNLEDHPGQVAYALSNPKKVAAVPLSREFKRTDLYRQFRTPAEIAEDEERERQAISPPPAAASRASPPDGPSPYLDDDPGWLALVGDGLADELAGLVEISAVDGVPLYRFDTKQPWINQRSAVPLRKALTIIVGKAVLVEFVPPRRENQHGNT